MYELFFGLEKAPFSLSPDPFFLYGAPRMREALSGVLHGVLNRRGFVVVTGDSGTGKSTLLRAVLGHISAEKLASSLVFNPLVKPEEFLELVMLDFGLTNIPSSKPQRLMMLNQFLLDNHRDGKTSVLFIDEAHTLTPGLLEEIRLLTNFETADTKLLQIVLAGHSELDDMLEQHEMRQLKQRIAVRVGLQAFTAAETAAYMSVRWNKAGAATPLAFTPEAIQAVWQFSHGIPRSINALCDNALLNAFGSGKAKVDRSMVMESANDLRLTSTVAALPATPAHDFAMTIGELPSARPSYAQGLEESLGLPPIQIPLPPNRSSEESNRRAMDKIAAKLRHA